MAVGATGTGKSTLMNAFLQGVNKMKHDKNMNFICTESLEYNGRVVFDIGHEAKSKTEAPGFYQHNGIYFVDCPGIDDQEKIKEFPNQTAVNFIQ